MFPLRPLEPEQINLTSKLIRFIITAARLKKLKSANMKKTFNAKTNSLNRLRNK